ncbi:MAG: CDP-glycerol glycerophosphotransferase family protein [Candidatus Cloacimonadota bacterium]|nr:CDP-glycerol glycerophosphotransferase family protein [Candidatus Cloacimonadota bacterium]
MKFLFYISKKYSIPIIQPIVKYLRKTDYIFSLFVSKKVATHIPEELKDLRIFTNVENAIKFNPDFILCPGNFIDFRIPGIKVQLFHGLGIEKKSHYKIRHFFDVYCTSGPFVTKQFNKLQEKYKYFLVQETGWAKVDHILNYNAKNFRENFRIPQNKKVILFAPTHSQKMQSAEDLLPIIPRIIRNDEFWMIKFHEIMSKQIIQMVRDKNIKIIQDYDITPYLHAADILISDTSSVIYEFMLLNKPIITYRTKSKKNKGINILKPEELRDAIDRSFRNPTEFEKNHREHIQAINPYCDGKISENIIQTLINIKNNNELPDKRKPLNLFRKMQIIYHSKYKKGYLR